VISLLPRTPIERLVFVALCLLGRVVEEFLFRGFAFFMVSALLQSRCSPSRS